MKNPEPAQDDEPEPRPIPGIDPPPPDLYDPEYDY